MKYLKIYENFDESFKKPYFAFEDDFLTIHKINNGVNKGKILFKFLDKTGFDNPYSMTLGCAKILDSEYENYSDIREIKIEGRFIKVQKNTAEAILHEFLLDMGYEIPSMSMKWVYDIKEKLWEEFEDKIISIPGHAKDLGDVLDGLRKVRNEVFEFQKDHFEKWQLDRDINKYNL